VALLAWDPAAEGNDPQVLARWAEIAYGAHAVLYPAPGGDHSALGLLLAAFTDDRFPPSADLATRAARPPTAPIGGDGPDVVVRWVPAAEPVEHFTGRAEELARLDRWAADRQVALVGVIAWGGAGKTALVTHWVQEAGGASRPFTPAEGSELLATAGGGWLAEDERRDLVRAVDGHALATGVLAGLLATGPPASDLAELRARLAAAARTDTRVGKVLQFYAGKLREPDRYLLAAVSLFARPVPAPTVLAVAEHDAFAGRLAGGPPQWWRQRCETSWAGWPPGTGWDHLCASSRPRHLPAAGHRRCHGRG
jgi:hypothetical protein